MPIDEDWTVFLADFGVDVTIAGAPARGIFRRPYVEMMGLSSSAPTLSLPTSAAAAAVQGAQVVVLGEPAYRVRSPEPDGSGWTVLSLELA